MRSKKPGVRHAVWMKALGVGAAALVWSGTVHAAAPVVAVQQQDYPAVALQERLQGDVKLWLDIGASGKVENCQSTSSKKLERLREVSCAFVSERILDAAPAQDLRLVVRWQLEKSGSRAELDFGGATPISPETWLLNTDYPIKLLEAGESGIVVFEYVITRGGGVAKCTVTKSSGFERLDLFACELFTKRARFLPAPDGAGGVKETRGRSQFAFIVS